MKYRILSQFFLTGWLALGGLSSATTALSAGTDSIASLFDSQTYAVLVLNPDQVNLQASLDKVREWMHKAGPDWAPTGDLNSVSNEVDAVQVVLEKWLRDFRQAGGHQVFMLANATDGFHLVVAVRLTPEGNREAIEKLLEPVLTTPFIGSARQMKGDYLLLGHSNALSRIVSGKPVDRADLAQALKSVDGHGIGLVLSPAPDQRRVLQEMLPQLILGKNQVPTAPLVKGVNWASVGIKLPPEIQLKLSLQALGEGEVKTLNETLQTILKGLPGLVEDPALNPVLEALGSKLKVQTDQNRLTLVLDAPSLENLLLGQLLPALAQAKGKAQMINKINNAKQIGLACRMFENDNKKWPDDLKQLTAKGGYLDNPKVLTVPNHPELEIGFEYLLPGKNLTKYPPGEHIVLYEKHSSWPPLGLCVGFMDGSVQWIKEQSRFEALLAATKTRNAEP